MNKLYSTFSKSHKNRFERHSLAGLCTKVCFMKDCFLKLIAILVNFSMSINVCHAISRKDSADMSRITFGNTKVLLENAWNSKRMIS